MKEIYTDDGIELVNISHTSLVLADDIRRCRGEVRRIRRKRDLTVKGFEVIAAVSLALNILQAVVIYILQAGPM